MALKGLKKPINKLIHHSDRGIQYCSKAYVKLLQDNGIQVSMTEKGSPLDNAIAERINGILKDEYLYNYQVKDLSEAKNKLFKAIKLYNEERPHLSIGHMKPSDLHDNNQKTEKSWRNYYAKKGKDELLLEDDQDK